jgi:hypothetical protein
MSKEKSLLFGSLALNLWLLGALLRLLAAPSNPTLASAAYNSTPVPAAPGPNGFANGDLPGFCWSQLESTDYRTYIKNLRAVGCPEETVRDIILAEINKLYAPKFSAARRPDARQNYWQSPPSWSPDTYAQQKGLHRERSGLIRELLGVDPDEESRKNDTSGREQDDPLAFLPASKRQPLRDLEEKYFNLERRIYAEAHGIMTTSDRASLAELQQQKAREVDLLLTSQERLEYQLRESPTARRLQQELTAFQPTEAEFRAICQAQIAFDERTEALRSSGSGAPSPRNDDALQAQIREALGDQRYFEYLRSKDPAYQTLVRIADRFGLPETVASQVLELKQSAETQSQEVAANTGLTSGEKQVWLKTLQDQVGETLTGVLGEKGFSAYHDYGGAWIERLGR